MKKRRLLTYLALIGPGIITAMIDNDASGITTYSVAGARYGYSLLWTMLPTTVALIVVQEMIARLGIVTGKGLSDLIREHYGIKSTIFMMFGLFFANLGTTIANLSGLASSMEIMGVTKFITVPVAATFIWLLISKGNYHFMEKILLLACVLYAGYVFSGIAAKPNWSEVIYRTFVPDVKLTGNYAMMSIAIIGTTITPWMQFYYQSSIVEKGLKPDDIAVTKFEVVLSCIITDVISYFIIVTCGALLYPAGIAIMEAHDAAGALAPFAGRYASVIFAVSLANASLLGAIIVPLATAYYICEALGWETGVGKPYDKAPQFRWIYSIIVFTAAVIVIMPGAPLVFFMLLSSVLNGILLPFVLVYMISLVNKKRIMGDFVNPKGYNYVSWALVIVLILLTIFMLVSMLI